MWSARQTEDSHVDKCPQNITVCHLTSIVLMTILAAMIFIPSSSFAQTFSGKLVKVLDGDTVEVLFEGKARRIRLAQIDAPEKDQPFGQAAKRFVLESAAHQVVRVDVETVDRYGRSVGEVFLPTGQNLNQMIVASGFAWQYKRYSKDPAYGDLETQARIQRLGLWQDKSPVPPWDWRKGKRQ